MTIKRILIPVANNEQGQIRKAIESGFTLAQQLGATVIITNVQHGRFLNTPEGTNQEVAQKILEPWLLFGQRFGVNTIISAIEAPDAAEAICTVARDASADLIFMPTHAREGLKKLLLGSVAERVIRLSMIPVMLMRLEGQRYPVRFEHIIVPVDGSEPNTISIRHACDLASAMQARVTLLHIIQDELAYVTALDNSLHKSTGDTIQSLMENDANVILEKARGLAFPFKVHTKAVHSDNIAVSTAINQETQNLHGDLIVIGTHGLRGVQRLLLSSVAEAVAHHAPVAVMLVSSAQKAELWQPSELGKLAREVAAERASQNNSHS
jgi:nucleotide-binding universal stress UspA family protein